jgi:hypothetical protein
MKDAPLAKTRLRVIAGEAIDEKEVSTTVALESVS